jgi:hypothetical protein
MYRIASKSRSTVGTSHTSTRRVRVALSVVLLALAAQAPRTALAQTAAPTLPATPAPSAASAATVGAEALARCERAVRQALLPQAGAAAEVRFSVTPPVPRSLSDGSQIVLQGEGQWREAAALRKFKYSCTLDPHSSEAVGVVIRQMGSPLAPRVRMVVAPIDLVSEGSVSQVVVGGCGVVVEGRCGGQRAALSTASRPVRASASSTTPQPGAAAIPPRF